MVLFLSYEGAHTLMPINPAELWVNIAVYAHMSRRTHTGENTHRSSSSGSCVSLWVSAHLLDWLSTVKLAVDSKCFH